MQQQHINAASSHISAGVKHVSFVGYFFFYHAKKSHRINMCDCTNTTAYAKENVGEMCWLLRTR